MVFSCPAQPFYFERIAKQTEQNQQDFQQLGCSLNERRELIEFRYVAEKEDRKQSAAKEKLTRLANRNRCLTKALRNGAGTATQRNLTQ
ncbi:hypothetical protein AJ88_11890 [Mesorhizobium amorphae CCBAU 01583]|nr:hypothetical protein AJ88_11890 [Mesorhizobium amorphae CCBAU 01583]